MEALKPKILLRSLLFSYLLSALLLLAISFALYKFRLKESQIQASVTLVYILSGALGGFVAGRSVRRQRFLCGLIAGLAYFLVLTAVSFLLGKGIHTELPQILSIAGMCIGGGVLGGILS